MWWPELLMIGWGEEMRPALLRHRTARTVPLLCGHTTWGLDERGMAPAPARQHRRYTSILVFVAPRRLGVRMCLSRKDAKVIRHRTARAVPLACRLQIRPSRQVARVIRRSPPVNAMFFKSPKHGINTSHDSSARSNDRGMAPSRWPPVSDLAL